MTLERLQSENATLNLAYDGMQRDLTAQKEEAIRLVAENAELRKELLRMKKQQAVCLDQANQGVFVDHDCPAMFACAAIIVELGEPPTERVGMEVAR